MRRSGLLLAILLLSCQGGAATGPELNVSDYEGKVVILDFWASWCVPCRRSFPWLNDMHARYGDDGLVIIGVNLDQERSEAEAFLQEFPAQFQIHFDESKALATKYEVIAMPSSYVLGPDGEIVKRHYGFKVKKQEEYEAAIVSALEKLK
jgi:thiol-disulfide isomerase/thioredoxin